MERKQVNTEIGEISINIKKVDGTTPIIFLHGVYFDHNLWNYCIERIADRTVITVDMPFHGRSKNIKIKNWTLDDCASMLLEIMDALTIDRTFAIGHSWGSMTILRAAQKDPNRFLALGLCNMPFKESTKKEVLKIKFQHSAMLFRKFYMKQAAKSLMGKDSIDNDPGIIDKLITPMSKLTNREIKYTDNAVRVKAKDTTHLISRLLIPTFALIGESDYVGIPPIKKTKIVNGGHVSPIEVPEKVYNFVKEIIQLK
jgi:pimeloyl-ACP methyl ester carboxylesterase